MTDKNSSRRRFLRTLPVAVGLAAGCPASPSGTTEPGTEATRTPGDAPDPGTITGTATATSTEDQSTAVTSTDTSTPAADPISTDITPDILSYHPRRARVVREFLPMASPASIAVGFPAERTATTQGYCFDAGPCRLRYAWEGSFISIPYVKDDGPARLDGQLYYRPRQGFPLRFGAADREPDAVAFQGYSLVDRLPQFRYEADGTAVRQHVRPLSDGRGFEQAFEMPDADGPVWYVPGEESGLSTDASAGEWTDGRLSVSASEAAEFTVTLEVQS